MADGYYANANPDLLARLPLSARHVLEIGCGEGALAARYRLRNPVAHLTGIEAHPPAAARARAHFDRLIEGDAEQIDDAEIGGPFDLIILGDTLEHLADPVAMLRRLHGMLMPEGVLALSVPNIAHWSALRELFLGNWPDADSGLFDRTHRSFWTLGRLTSVLEETGFVWRKMSPRNFALNAAEKARWLPVLTETARQMGLDTTEFTKRAEALQYVVIAQRSDLNPPIQPLIVDMVARDTRLLAARGVLPGAALHGQANVHQRKRSLSTAAHDAQGGPRVLVFQRLDVSDPDAVIRLLARAMAGGWACVLDYDDSPDLVARAIPGFDTAAFEALVPAFHALQLSTPALMTRMSGLHPERRLRRNAVLELAPPRVVAQPSKDASQPVRVFFGALNRGNISADLARALAPVIAAHPQIDFVVIHDKAFHDALPTDRKTLHPLVGYADYQRILGECDIALMPLAGDLGEDCKSDLKFIEAAAQGVAAIVSPLVYGDTVQHGKTAMVARDLAHFPVLLDHLIAQPRRRQRIADRARAYVAGLDGGAGRMFCHDIAQDEAWLRDLVARQADLTAAAAGRSAALAAALDQLGYLRPRGQ